MLSQCRSPYVTEYYGAYLQGTKLWIVMELMACSVADMVRAIPPPSPSLVRSLLLLPRMWDLHIDQVESNCAAAIW